MHAFCCWSASALAILARMLFTFMSSKEVKERLKATGLITPSMTEGGGGGGGGGGAVVYKEADHDFYARVYRNISNAYFGERDRGGLESAEEKEAMEHQFALAFRTIFALCLGTDCCTKLFFLSLSRLNDYFDIPPPSLTFQRHGCEELNALVGVFVQQHGQFHALLTSLASESMASRHYSDCFDLAHMASSAPLVLQAGDNASGTTAINGYKLIKETTFLAEAQAIIVAHATCPEFIKEVRTYHHRLPH